jgi:hypothetical protein
MTIRIRGPFDVKLTPQPPADPGGSWEPGRMSIAKQFYGALQATSQGIMLAARTEEEGSAGYVAIERVSGTLEGREGTFMLQHDGIMDRGAKQLRITVIPGSGTGALQGLRGTMDVVITDGKHEYDFELSLP